MGLRVLRGSKRFGGTRSLPLRDIPVKHPVSFPAVPHIIREPIGLPYRLRQPVGRGQPQCAGASGGQGNSVADRYKNRFHSVLSSQDGADRFAFVRQERIVSPPVPWRMIIADQTTLGTSDRGKVE